MDGLWLIKCSNGRVHTAPQTIWPFREKSMQPIIDQLNPLYSHLLYEDIMTDSCKKHPFSFNIPLSDYQLLRDGQLFSTSLSISIHSDFLGSSCFTTAPNTVCRIMKSLVNM